MPVGLDTVLGVNAARAQGARPPLTPDQLSSYIAVNADGTRVGLLRQDRHGPGPVHRHRPDRRRRARRAVQGRHRDHGPTPHQREPGRRVGLDRHPVRRQADARWPRPKRAACWSRWRPRSSARRPISSPSSTAWCSAAFNRDKKSLLRRADRRPLLQRPARVEQADRQHALRPRQGEAEEAPEDYKIVGKSIPRDDIAPKVFGTGGLRHRRQGAGHGARPHDPPAGRGRDAGEDRRRLDQGHPGRARGSSERLPRRRRRQGMGRDQGGREAQGRMVGRQAAVPGPGRALRPHPQGAGAQARGREGRSATSTTPSAPPRAWSRPNTNGRSSRMPAWARPAPWSTIEDGKRHVSGPARRSRTSCATASPRMLGVPVDKVERHLGGRPRLLRPQRRRRRRDGRRRAGQGGRQAGARAIHARRRHRLGPEGPGLDPPRPRRDRRRRQGHRLRVHSARASRAATCRPTSRAPERHARRPLPRRAAEVRRHVRRRRRRPTSSPTSARRGRRSRRCSSAARRCAPRICAIRSDRRSTSPASPSSTRWRTRSAPIRSSSACSYLKNPRDVAVHQGGGREVRLGAAALAAQGPDRRHGDRPRHRLCAAQRHHRRDRRRGRGRPPTGKIWARKFTVAHDCGQIINPTGLEHCIEGNIIQGISRTLWEEVRFDNKNVTSVDWMTYPILDITEAPETDRHRAASTSPTSRRPAPASRRSGRWRPRSPTRSSTPPACASAACRSRPTA